MISVQCRVLSREFVRVQHRGIHALPSAHSLSWMTQQSQPLRSKKYGFHKLSATRILKAKSPKSLLVYCDKKMGRLKLNLTFKRYNIIISIMFICIRII